MKILKKEFLNLFLRPIIQYSYLAFFIFVGFKFFDFYKWAISGQGIPPTRPSAVEAFLPLSALMGAKRLILTGQYDEIHPAGLTIFLALIFSSFLFRKGFCGWVCPIGTISNLFEILGKRLKIAFSLPRWLDLPLLSLKYILLGFFLYIILIQMNIIQIEQFIFSPYNIAADAKMLRFFLSPSKTTLIVIISLIGFSLAVRNCWCRYLCPYGLFLGFFAFLGPVQIKREEKFCINCKKCERICPSQIKITSYKVVRNFECIGCTECISICKERCLRVKVLPPLFSIIIDKGIALPKFVIPVGVITTIFIFWIVAKTTGHWESHLSANVFAKMYNIVLGQN